MIKILHSKICFDNLLLIISQEYKNPKFAPFGPKKIFAPTSQIDGIQDLPNQCIGIEVGKKTPDNRSYTILPKRLVTKHCLSLNQ